MRLARWSAPQRLFATVGSSIIVLLFAALTYVGIVREQKSQLRADHSDTIIRTIDIALARLADAETGQRGYLLTGNDQYLAPYTVAEHDVETYLARLDSLTSGDAPQHARLDTLSALATARFAELETAVELRGNSGIDAALTMVGNGRGRRAMADSRRVATEMKGAETLRLKARIEREARYSLLLRWILVVGTLIAVAASLLANLLLSRYAREQETAARELDAHNSRLREQSLELELQNQQLHEQAIEMELQQQYLQEQTSEMEAQKRHACR